MGPVKSCCIRPVDDKLMVTKMDLSHCGCLEVPHVVFNAERCIETLILASNQISSLPPQLFHCQEMKHLNLNDNCLSSIPPAIGSFLHLVSLKLDKNNLQELPEDLKMCKKLKRLSLSNNPWKQVPNIVTQLISLEELYMNDCELNFLPASVGRLSKLRIIELRNNNLCNLPLSMTRLELLSRLDISDNEFNEFPPCISKLKGLKELLLDNNDVEEIIDIKNLVHLEHLDASYNHIIKVSETIGCCIHLNMLNLSYNYIEQLPNSIGNITYLQTLQLEMNELTEIPKSLGKLSYLEELNLCNNKLYTLPSTIGLLRNLRNLNVSRNIIEEFPPEIGSCSRLGIINAAYNRLQVLPPEIGYLNNLKVLDLVGNFLMYLPITIINLRGVRAIWLSANQNVPLIPFTEDLNLASGERFLTNIALPQLGEIPLSEGVGPDKKGANNEKAPIWNKKISFAEDEDILPGKLHRTPTPFPKELRAPNKKHQKQEEQKKNENYIPHPVNYVNVIDGIVREQDLPLLPPASMNVTTGGNAHNISEGFAGQIREANIRRKNKDTSFEITSQSLNERDDINIESESAHENKEPTAGENDISEQVDAQEKKEDLPQPESPVNRRITLDQPGNSQPLSHRVGEPDGKDDLKNSTEKSSSPCHVASDEENSNESKQQVIYSNLLNDDSSGRIPYDSHSKEGTSEISAQRIREMYHNDIIYGSHKKAEFHTAEGRVQRRSDFNNGVVESLSNHFEVNNSTYREHTFAQASSRNIDVCRTVHRQSSEPLPSTSTSESFGKNSPTPVPVSENLSPELQKSLSKQHFNLIAEQMKNRNIGPPCYEIAKLYSTKAALFENNRVDQLKSN